MSEKLTTGSGDHAREFDLRPRDDGKYDLVRDTDNGDVYYGTATRDQDTGRVRVESNHKDIPKGDYTNDAGVYSPVRLEPPDSSSSSSSSESYTPPVTSSSPKSSSPSPTSAETRSGSGSASGGVVNRGKTSQYASLSEKISQNSTGRYLFEVKSEGTTYSVKTTYKINGVQVPEDYYRQKFDEIAEQKRNIEPKVGDAVRRTKPRLASHNLIKVISILIALSLLIMFFYFIFSGIRSQ